MAAGAPADGGGLVDRLLSFIAALREAGVNASQSEAIDAFRVTRHVDLVDRVVVREALAAVTVSSLRDRAVFDDLFDLWFPVRLGTADGRSLDDEFLDDAGEVDDDAFTEALLDAQVGS